uniref:Transmembrane protein n=1 Tax=Medicago truncatula TaxID=3880 RepID=I3STU0_MEDTR|nr:unknown [Medicago truncatula]
MCTNHEEHTYDHNTHSNYNNSCKHGFGSSKQQCIQCKPSFSSGFFGSKSDTIFLLKYASASICLLISFLCSSMAIGFLIDANFLMNAYGDFLSGGYTQSVLEKGFTLAFVGNRVFCVAIPLMLWMLGPVLVFLASIALVCLLHEFDYVPKFPQGQKRCTNVK